VRGIGRPLSWAPRASRKNFGRRRTPLLLLSQVPIDRSIIHITLQNAFPEYTRVRLVLWKFVDAGLDNANCIRSDLDGRSDRRDDKVRSEWETDSIVAGRPSCKLLACSIVPWRMCHANVHFHSIIHLRDNGLRFLLCRSPLNGWPETSQLLLTFQTLSQILHYGSKIHKLSTSENHFTHELYRSSSSDTESPSNPNEMNRPLKPNPKKGVIKVEQKSCPQFLAMLGAKSLTTKKPTPTANAKADPKSTASSTTKTQPLTLAKDAALAQLQSSMASENAKKAENTYDWHPGS
jgi:hypothetical protein